MTASLLSVHVVVETVKFGNSTLSFARLRQRIVLKCVPHVQHDYFSSFIQPIRLLFSGVVVAVAVASLLKLRKITKHLTGIQNNKRAIFLLYNLIIISAVPLATFVAFMVLNCN